MALREVEALTLVQAPAALPVLTSEAKDQLRVSGSDEDMVLDRLIDAAVAYVDAQGVLGRAIITQSWRQVVQNPSNRVHLTMHPVQSLTSVKYYDSANSIQTDTFANYQLIKGTDWAYVEPTSGNVWPSAYARPDAVQIEFKAGYGDAAADVPENIRHAILLLVGHWHDNRESAGVANLTSIPLGFEAMLNGERRSWYG